MRIKKYLAKTFLEGKLAIQNDLGEEAIILSSRNIQSPEGENLLEIVAALDESTNLNIRPIKDKVSDTIQINNNAEPNVNHNDNAIGTTEVYAELSNLRLLINDISDNIKYRHSGSMSSEFSKLYKLLRKAELSEEFSLYIVNILSRKDFTKELPELIEEAKLIITKEILIHEQLKIIPNKTQKIMFIGMTGSGKTSSLIKIAVICKLLLKARVLIVSADSYKVGGADQLQTFASIAGLNFRSVYNGQELNGLLKNEKEYDFIFIDTPGRNYKEEQSFKALKNLIEMSEPDQTMMVLSATTSESTLTDNLKCFKSFKPNSIVLTKIDECSTIGGIVGFLAKSKLPLIYLATGQKIPDDIEPADRNKISNFIFENSF
jgi:flagellar biosynthesis protein FlhF